MKKFGQNIFTLPALLILILCMSGTAPAAAQSDQDKHSIANVKADNMVYDSNSGKVTFSGNVKVRHPDFYLTSKLLTLTLAGDTRNTASSTLKIDVGKVETITAEQSVQIELPQGRSASCEKATYTVDTEILVMLGNPVLKEAAGNQIRGNRIVFYFGDNSIDFQGQVELDIIGQPGSSGRTPSILPQSRTSGN